MPSLISYPVQAHRANLDWLLGSKNEDPAWPSDWPVAPEDSPNGELSNIGIEY